MSSVIPGLIMALIMLGGVVIFFIDPYNIMSWKTKAFLILIPKDNSFKSKYNRYVAAGIHIMLIVSMWILLGMFANPVFVGTSHVAVGLFELLFWPFKYVIVFILTLRHPEFQEELYRRKLQK